MRNKAQAWTLDFIVAFVLFFTALFVFYGYYSGSVSEKTGDLENLRREAQGISNFLMSEGYPSNWNSSNVERIGIVDSGFMLNSSKLESLASMDYYSSKSLLNADHDYYFYFSDSANNSSNLPSFGKPGINSTSLDGLENPDRLVSVSRFVFYDKHLYRMVIYLWE